MEDRSRPTGWLVGILGLYLIVKALSFLPRAASWTVYLAVTGNHGQPMGSLVASICSEFGTFVILMLSGAVLLSKRKFLGQLLGDESQQSHPSGMDIVRPLVGLLGIWFLVNGLTSLTQSVEGDSPLMMKHPYFIAYALQALSGLGLLLSSGPISRFISFGCGNRVENTVCEQEPGEVRETSSRPSG